MKKSNLCISVLLLALPLFMRAQVERIDSAMVQKIRKEGLQHSRVMDIAFQLTDVSGSRLTNSPGYYRAGQLREESVDRMGTH